MFKPGKNQFFTFTFIILTIFVKGQMDSDNTKLLNQFDADDTHEITDNDLKLALSDLSLNELKSLQEFIDSTDYNDLNYQENGFVNSKPNTLNSNDFDAQKLDNIMEFNPEEDDYNLISQNNENDLFYYPKTQGNFNQFPQENQRTKRDDQKSTANDEYIKQLDYSFPQNEPQSNSNNDIELKKPHVRVKRN